MLICLYGCDNLNSLFLKRELRGGKLNAKYNHATLYYPKNNDATACVLFIRFGHYAIRLLIILHLYQ